MAAGRMKLKFATEHFLPPAKQIWPRNIRHKIELTPSSLPLGASENGFV